MADVQTAADPRRQARDLRVALEGLAMALASGDATAVLDHEPVVRAALAPRDGAPALTSEARAEARRDLEAARAALARCRALGTANAVLVNATLDALGRSAGYTRQGAEAARPSRSADLARV